MSSPEKGNEVTKRNQNSLSDPTNFLAEGSGVHFLPIHISHLPFESINHLSQFTVCDLESYHLSV